METHESYLGAGDYLFVCQNGDIRYTPATVFFRIGDDSLSQHLLDLFEMEYGESEGRPTFHAQAVADSPDTDQILLDEALDELAVYDDPDPGVYDPPLSRQTILRAFYAHRAELWVEILRSRMARNHGFAKRNGNPLMNDGHTDGCRTSASDLPATSNQNKPETPTELAQMQRLLECLVRIDNGVMSLGGKLTRLRGEDPHGLISQSNSNRASFDQVQEIQERIEKWAMPILEAAREAQEVCTGISNCVESFIDDPIRWETDLRETLRLLRDVVVSLPHTHGSERDEAQIVSLAMGLYTQGTRLEDGLRTLEAREAHPVKRTGQGMKERENSTASNGVMPNKAQQFASALQELRLATGELLHRSEKVDIYPEPEINAYHHALRDAESLVDGISSHLAYGRENPGQIETDIRETLHDLSREMEHVASDYNDRPGAYPLSKEETAPGWKALKGLMPIEMALKMTTMKPGADGTVRAVATTTPSSVEPSHSTAADVLSTEEAKYEWARQAELVRATDQVLSRGQLNKGVLARACGSQIETNGKTGQGSRVKVNSFLPWIARKFGLAKDELTQIRNAIIGEINDRKS